MIETQPNLDEPLRLHPLTYLEDGDDVTVGRSDINSYGVFPPDGAALAQQLAGGISPNQAAAWYHQEYGETVDMAEFLEILEELDFIVPEGEEAAAVPDVRWQGLGRALFSPLAWVAYVAVVAAAVTEMFRSPHLVPRYQHLFFTHNSLTILSLGIVLGQLPWMLLHEASHALAGRRLGLNSKLTIGRRFYYLVFVTSLDGLVAVPRSKRYLPMLAGMLLDVLAIAALILAAAPLQSASGAGAFFYKLFLSMAFGVVMRLAWQFYFFLRTDLFFLAATVLGCNDLQGASRLHLTNRCKRLLGQRSGLASTESWTSRDLSVARWYSWLMVAGYGFLCFVIATVMVPTAVRIVAMVFHQMRHQHSLLGVGDLLLFLVLNFGELVLAGFLAVRGFSRARRFKERAAVAPQAEVLAPAALNTPAT